MQSREILLRFSPTRVQGGFSSLGASQGRSQKKVSNGYIGYKLRLLSGTLLRESGSRIFHNFIHRFPNPWHQYATILQISCLNFAPAAEPVSHSVSFLKRQVPCVCRGKLSPGKPEQPQTKKMKIGVVPNKYADPIQPTRFYDVLSEISLR